MAGVRRQAFIDAMKRHLPNASAPKIYEGDFRFDGGRLAASRVLAEKTLPTAVIVANDLMALGAIQEFKAAGLHIPDAAVARGLAEVKWPARIEVISRNPVVVLDSAHNVPSATALVTTLRQWVPVTGAKRVVFAVSSDKQYEEMLALLAGYFDHFHLTQYGNNPRCVPPEKLAELLAKVSPGKPFTLHPTATDAWTAARAATTPDGLVCVTGSVFLAGELHAAVRG